jgi:hypothetical protein
MEKFDSSFILYRSVNSLLFLHKLDFVFQFDSKVVLVNTYLYTDFIKMQELDGPAVSAHGVRLRKLSNVLQGQS